MAKVTCPECNGIGKITEENPISAFPGLVIRITGATREVICGSCRGTGKVEERK